MSQHSSIPRNLGQTGLSSKNQTLSTAGAAVMNGMGSSIKSSKQSVNFKGFVEDLEEEINETRKELNFCKKEVQILNTERETVLEMARTKLQDIDKYLHKEIRYLDELIVKDHSKQVNEFSKFWHQTQQIKQIEDELDDHRMELVKRILTVQDHLGVETGPLEAEAASLSGKYEDVSKGAFQAQFTDAEVPKSREEITLHFD